MKKLLFVIALAFQIALKAQLAPAFQPDIDTNIVCQPFDRFSEWENTSGNTAIGYYINGEPAHNWIYAEKCDLNPCGNLDLGITTAIYTLCIPCGCTSSEIEARVCSVCFQHQRRIHTWGREGVLKGGSLYSIIMNQHKQ